MKLKKIRCGNKECRKWFKPRNSLVRFCSLPCGYTGRRTGGKIIKERNCEHCGKPFQPKASHIRFCSTKCGYAGQQRGGSILEVKPCAYCQTPFQPKENSARFCSVKCGYAGRVSAGSAKAEPDVVDRAELEKQIARLSRKQSLWDVVGGRILEAIKDLPSISIGLPPSRVVPVELDDEEWVLLISDMQTGSRVSSKSTGALGGFDIKILVEQIDFLKQSIVSILKYHANKPRVIRIPFLGDLIDGSTIFPGQLRAIEQTAVEQIILVVEQMSGFIAYLATLFAEVRCYGVIGNHGRLGKKGENDPMDNLDYLVYRWMAERACKHERVTFDVADSWFQIVQINGWKFLMVHGDDIPPGTWGIPFYGALRGESRWAKLLKEVQFDYMVMGDKHTPGHFGNILMNGCWPGGSEFSLKRMIMGGMPTQKLFAVHKRFGITWQRDVLLRPPVAPKVRVYQ